MREYLTSRSRRKRWGQFTLHQVDGHYGDRTYCGKPSVETAYRSPAAMLGFHPCGRCWTFISWGNVEVEARRQAAETSQKDRKAT